MENAKIVNSFIDYLRIEKNYSIKTIESYKIDLDIFCLETNKNLCNICEEDIMNYLKVLYDKKVKRSTICRKISTFKSFYKWMKLKNKIVKCPTDYIAYPKKEKKLPNYIEYNDLENILKVSSLNNKDNLIVELLYATGIRVSELINIKLNDIDYLSNTIRVMGKGSRERIVYFGWYALESLKKYIENDRLKELNGTKSIWLFPSKKIKAKHITSRAIELRIEKIVKYVSIKNKISPHTLRHTFATHMLNNGCDIRVVQELLGHENLNTTEVYTHITSEEIRKTYLKFHRRHE